MKKLLEFLITFAVVLPMTIGSFVFWWEGVFGMGMPTTNWGVAVIGSASGLIAGWIAHELKPIK